MIAIIMLVLGIIAFAKGRVSVNSTKEVHGAPLYVVATLLCLPLPLSFAGGLALGVWAGMNGTEISDKWATLIDVGMVILFGLAATIVSMVFAKPKQLFPMAPMGTFPGQPGYPGAPMYPGAPVVPGPAGFPVQNSGQPVIPVQPAIPEQPPLKQAPPEQPKRPGL